jgi:hypothetical protein
MRARALDAAPCLAYLFRHAVALLDDGAALLGADHGAIAIAELIELAFAQASGDPGEQHGSD